MPDVSRSGSLFTRDYLLDAIKRDPEYERIDSRRVIEELKAIFDAFPSERSPSEAKTEDDLIWRVLAILGWNHFERQVNLAAKGRDNVPDGLLFLDQASKSNADSHSEDWKKYEHGAVIVESKRWKRQLDRSLRKENEANAPSTQMLRYLRRVDDLTNGGLRWGILTNGAVWRLYYQGARSVSEQFFEINLDSLFSATEEQYDTEDSDEYLVDRDHSFKIFALMFRRDSFAPSETSRLTFHARALEEGQYYEKRIARNLSDVVFETVFPTLAKSIASDKPHASLDDVRQAAMILLYRLLFLLYAEDRNLLPVHDRRYDAYSIRRNVRSDIKERKERNETFSGKQYRYWLAIDELSRAIDEGDSAIGLPPYDGGLFDREALPLLEEVRIPDKAMADVIDLLCHEIQNGQRRYINYRDLGVQELGTIYERLLEFEVARDHDEEIIIRPNIFARKSSGSYYTPDDLVRLVVKETLSPLIKDRLAIFRDKAHELANADIPEDDKLRQLRQIDPATALLKLRICDPAMGSGHFLVNLVDFLSDTVIGAMAESTSIVDWAEELYVSPLADQLAKICDTIKDNAEENEWVIENRQLEDQHIVRRMVLKRCIYGVDKNPMAVELAKVSLWLHTFTIGAPLSFLDHHLRCGDSLFGETVGRSLRRLNSAGQELLIKDPLSHALSTAESMQVIEMLTDVEIAEAHRSASIFKGIVLNTTQLDRFMKIVHAIDWLRPEEKEDRSAIQSWLDGLFDNPFAIAAGIIGPKPKENATINSTDSEDSDSFRTSTNRKLATRFEEILKKAEAIIEQERFLNWEVAFPGVWQNWDGDRKGGFDAIVGNPPWDRIKFQELEWFAMREPEIAKANRASDRKRMILELKENFDPLYGDYELAKSRAESRARMVRETGDYPLLSSGDINIYSLFVERAMALLNEDGVMGLLTPSGIASDKTASEFFRKVAATGRLMALFDFENKKKFFPDIHSSFKFCAFIASRGRKFAETKYSIYLQDVSEINDPERCFPLKTDDFAMLNPNTGTAPVLRSRRDADLVRAIYSRFPVLANRSGKEPIMALPVIYERMFDMTNDSELFRTREELEEAEGAWHIGGNIWESETGTWVPLYEGKMVQAYDHRAADIVINPENWHRPGQQVATTDVQHSNPNWVPNPRYWVRKQDTSWNADETWTLGFKEITATTNARTVIAALLPAYGCGNNLPVWKTDGYRNLLPLFLANMNSIPFDFAIRQKVHGLHLNLFILEQIPVIPQEDFKKNFGPKTAEEIICRAVLELTYTSHDMAPFARDMGYVDENGDALPPFPWDHVRRVRLKAKLDAVFFHLYGMFDPKNRKRSREDILHIYSTFPIVERQETKAHERYFSRDLALAYCNILAAGQPDIDPEI